MYNTNLMQEISSLEQDIQTADKNVAELATKITYHEVALNCEAVGQADILRSYNKDMDNLLERKMSMQKKLNSLYEQQAQHMANGNAMHQSAPYHNQDN